MWTTTPDPSDLQYLIDRVNNLTDHRLVLTPVEWAERYRILPSRTTSKPGRWRADVAPYVREILNNMGPDSITREVAVMKGAQVCLTVTAENLIGYTIHMDPCPILFVTADENLAKVRMETAIDPMIDACGLRSRIFKQTEKKAAGKQGGDTQTKKEFPGGLLVAASIQSANSGRSMSFQRQIFDEIDAAKDELGRDGDPLEVFKARSSSYDKTKKVLYVSTPLEKESSKIYKLWKLGDRRYYYVPCIECGHMQTLKWEQIRYETTDDGILDTTSVHYLCEREGCGAKWKNHDKVRFLAAGEWRATKKSRRPGLISYHVSALYSPVGFKSWETICQEWLEANQAKKRGDVSKLRTFTNLVLGEPWEERGQAPPYELILARRAGYHYQSGELPDDGPLVLTAGADVQGDRVEVELVGWGRKGQSWSHSYHVLSGDVAGDEVWEKLAKVLETPRASEGGRPLPLCAAFVDCGFEKDIVYKFCSTMTGVFPCMGVRQIRDNWRNRFQVRALESYGLVRYNLNVNSIKDTVYTALRRGPNTHDEYPDSFCFFPSDYPESYFRQLTAEQKVLERNRDGHAIGYRWMKSGQRANEALDCRVYALAALEAYAHSVCVEQLKLDAIDWEHFWSLFDPEDQKAA